MRLRNFFQTKHSALLQIFLPEQQNIENHWEVAISEIPYPSMYQNDTWESLCFLFQKLSKSFKFNCLESGLHPSVTDFVEAMNTLVQERSNRCKNCITDKVSRRTQKLRFSLQMKDPVLHFLVRTWDTFLWQCWQRSWSDVETKRT